LPERSTFAVDVDVDADVDADADADGTMIVNAFPSMHAQALLAVLTV
jgi:hypothetical protein